VLSLHRFPVQLSIYSFLFTTLFLGVFFKHFFHNFRHSWLRLRCSKVSSFSVHISSRQILSSFLSISSMRGPFTFYMVFISFRFFFRYSYLLFLNIFYHIFCVPSTHESRFSLSFYKSYRRLHPNLYLLSFSVSSSHSTSITRFLLNVVQYSFNATLAPLSSSSTSCPVQVASSLLDVHAFISTL